jgi:serine/threonine protein phosphatase PrpC
MSARWRGEGGQHQGSRPYQEDSWTLRTLPDGALLAIVADGMGGHAGGAVASKLVVETFVAGIDAGKTLGEALTAANEAVKARAATDQNLTGMGSTLIAVRLKGDDLNWISVGDSPLYQVFAGRIERLNADHSLAPQIDALVSRGVITAEEGAAHPGRHTLREAVMGEPLTLIDEGSRRLVPGTTLLLCSDGVETLGHERIAAGSRLSVSGLIDAVLAARRQHQDNVTVIKLEQVS